MSKLKVLTIGGATIDTIIKINDNKNLIFKENNYIKNYILFEEGSKIIITNHLKFSGGGATNTAVSFSKLGYNTSFIGYVGNDLEGKTILNELNSFNINTKEVCILNNQNTANSYIITSNNGERTIFSYRGVGQECIIKKINYTNINQYKFIYITSLSTESSQKLNDIIKIANSKKIKIIINPGFHQLQNNINFINNNIDILILNYTEAKQLLLKLNNNCRLYQYDNNFESETTINILKKLITIIISKGTKNIIITNGKHGVYVANKKHIYFHRSLKINNIKNTLGAGDAFGSGFCAKFFSDNNEDYISSIKFGIINSSSVIQFEDAKTGLLTKEDIFQKFNLLSDNDLKILTLK